VTLVQSAHSVPALTTPIHADQPMRSHHLAHFNLCPFRPRACHAPSACSERVPHGRDLNEVTAKCNHNIHAVAAVFQAYQNYRSRGCAPLFPSWTLQFELLTAAMRTCTRSFGHRIVRGRHARYIRRQSEVVGTLRGWLACWSLGFSMEGVTVNGLEHMWLRAKDGRRGSESHRVVVVYVHGGGYAALSPRFHMAFCVSLAGEIMKLVGEKAGVYVDAFLVNYRKAPEHRYPAAEQDVLAMYEYLLEQEKLRPEQIILSGDCTGAELALATMLHLRRERGAARLPLGAVLACPVVDVAGLCEEEAVEAEVCILSRPMMQAIGRAYLPTDACRAAWRRSSWALHPDHDLSELPPVFVLAGGRDYLLSQARGLVDKACSTDGALHWEIDVQEDMPHVFTSFPGVILPVARLGIQRMARFAAPLIVKNLAQHSKSYALEEEGSRTAQDASIGA